MPQKFKELVSKKFHPGNKRVDKVRTSLCWSFYYHFNEGDQMKIQSKFRVQTDILMQSTWQSSSVRP